MVALVKKCWKGKVSVRSNVVKRALKKKEMLIITLVENETELKMTVPVDGLMNYTTDGKVYKSVYPPFEEYCLWDYTWIPNDINQLDLNLW